ncbi:putative bifunctional diguanylate cyclase/phosphodiesterase [Reinekea blandensis]|uniref:Signaling protein with a sensor domain, HAMP, GGDEF and EAL domains n=1 Tax=Reinekea blandensis MED297 TaxID=314283 RepID=A4BB86_9GAMM|nr:EAL domain-containing protein [Reinekea blandensis]EAR10699.1 Signaling protein with a sensor domain, HAMP, GGDEF and EAL domains [Reinekea sp. MED297] [Reinekea blandensis MED297]
MTVSFRNRLLIVFTILLGTALFVSTWAVLRAVDSNARSNAARELEVAERVFETLLEDNRRQLTDRTTLLAEDFGFRQAIATNEEDTIISVLANHGERIAADMILLMNPEGDIQISTHDLGVAGPELSTEVSQQPRAFAQLAVAENTPFQLVMVPVLAPELIAWVGVGFAIDDELIQRFRDITTTDVSMLYQESAQGPMQVLSTLSNANARMDGDATTFTSMVPAFESSLVDDEWLNRELVLLDRATQHVTLVLSVSLKDAMAAYSSLQNQMLIIAVVVLLLVVLASTVVASTITRPINVLVRAARRISKGNYRQQLSIPGRTEFAELGETLNQMQADIQVREARITYQAQHDMLTELPNRQYLSDLFHQRIAQPPGAHHCRAILVKIANFDNLSDVYGTQMLDRGLRQVASRLSQMLPDDDAVGRIATDELLLFNQGARDDGLSQVIDDILDLMTQPIHESNVEFRLSVRLGVLYCPDHAADFETVHRRSHIALSEGRAAGERWCVFEPDMESRHLRKLQVTERLQSAISERQFSLLFQPQYDLQAQRVHSAEALIRWHDDVLGPIYPDEFIPLAESSGMITQITDWVFDESLAQLARWHRAGHSLGVSINLSARDILKDDFIDRVIARIDQGDVDPKWLMLEVTESAVVEELDHAVANLQRLYDAGVSLAIDDFGTGFSSLAQLKVLPVHELKIDKSFVLNLSMDLDDQKIVRSTIEMAHHLGLSVIAEGVENEASMQLLSSMHCNAIQGYFLSKPIASDDIMTWLSDFRMPQTEVQHG